MQRLDLVSQARAYVGQAKQTISIRQKTKLLAIAQRLLAMSVKDSAGLTFISPREPIWPRRRRHPS